MAARLETELILSVVPFYIKSFNVPALLSRDLIDVSKKGQIDFAFVVRQMLVTLRWCLGSRYISDVSSGQSPKT